MRQTSPFSDEDHERLGWWGFTAGLDSVIYKRPDNLPMVVSPIYQSWRPQDKSWPGLPPLR